MSPEHLALVSAHQPHHFVQPFISVFFLSPANPDPVLFSHIHLPVCIFCQQRPLFFYRYFERVLNELMPEYNESAEDVLSKYDVRIEHTGESMDNLLKI